MTGSRYAVAVIRGVTCSAVMLLTAVAALADPLPSWRDGETKAAIVSFVEASTDPDSDRFVPVPERVAVFDNDGTLWTEKPLYVHFYGIIERLKAQAAADPTLADREPWKSAVSKDLEYFTQLYENAAYDTLGGALFAVPFGGMTAQDYDAWADDFAAAFKHPTLGRGIDGLVYQPMIEVMRLLEDNGFSVWIFTADEGAFLRRVSERLYGVPPERVQGTEVRSEYVVEEGRPVLRRTYRLEHLNNWDGKPRRIQSVIGRTPVFAAGNSNGDKHMLQATALSGGFSLLVQHTDNEREVAYSSHTDQVVQLAATEGWTVVDMKADWESVWPE